MRVVVTRPQRESLQWVRDLRAAGVDALALPLIEIAPAMDQAPLLGAWDKLDSYDAVMFVSGNAVAHFFEAKRPGERAQWACAAIKTRAWATGPGTREALVRHGVDPALIDAPPDDAQRFDSEALWHSVGSSVQAGQRVLLVRGGDVDGNEAGRGWLAQRLEDCGAAVDSVLAYRRCLPRWDDAGRSAAGELAGGRALWLFSSTEALGNLARLLPAQRWSEARAIATHQRIAQAARALGFGVVCESRPLLADVLASIKSEP